MPSKKRGQGLITVLDAVQLVRRDGSGLGAGYTAPHPPLVRWGDERTGCPSSRVCPLCPPCPPVAAVRAVQASAIGRGAILRAGTCGPPSGSGEGSSILAGLAAVARAPGATTGAATKAPLPGAGAGGIAGAARGWMAARPAHRDRAAGCRVLCLGRGLLPLPPNGIEWAPLQGGGGGRLERAGILGGSGLMGVGGQPDPHPSPRAGALAASTALGGIARGGATHERRFFRDIAYNDGVPGAAGLPSVPLTVLHGRGAGRRGR